MNESKSLDIITNNVKMNNISFIVIVGTLSWSGLFVKKYVLVLTI